jgi:nitrite reductase (NADH) small subunit
MLEAQVGEALYAVCDVEGELHAISGICPHRGGALAQGALHGRTLVCPWHAWQFDCVTGEHDYNPAVRLDSFPVRLEGDDILIEIPSSA